jgi:hypothetical protein
VSDWLILLAPSNGNLNNPPRININNWAIDGYCIGTQEPDRDHPSPGKDLRLSALTFDSYNIYFYLRRFSNLGGLTTVNYFLDINADRFINTGEPVISISFNSNAVIELSLAYYIANTETDFVVGKGNYMGTPSNGWPDGYTIKGTIHELFQSKNAGAGNALAENETFDAAVTENGMGIEFAFPWKFLKNWLEPGNLPLQYGDVFFHHISSVNGGGNYLPSKVADNMGGCCGIQLGHVGNPNAVLQSSSRQIVTPGQLYRYRINLLNTTNAPEYIGLGEAFLSNIVTVNGQLISPNQVALKIYKDINCNGLIDVNESFITYLPELGLGDVWTGGFLGQQTGSSTNAHGTVCLIVELSFAAPVTSFSLNFSPFANLLGSQPVCGFAACAGLSTDGGKPINPIGFVETESESKNLPINIFGNNETGINQPVIYPNPNKGSFQVKLPAETTAVDLYLFDVSGRIVQKRLGVTGHYITINKLNAGLYTLEIVVQKTKKRFIKKISVLK